MTPLMRNRQSSNILQTQLVLLATPTAIVKSPDQLPAGGIDIFPARATRHRDNALAGGVIAETINRLLRRTLVYSMRIGVEGNQVQLAGDISD